MCEVVKRCIVPSDFNLEDASTKLPAFHRGRCNCQAGTGTDIDTPCRFVDGEIGGFIVINKGVSPLTNEI